MIYLIFILGQPELSTGIGDSNYQQLTQQEFLIFVDALDVAGHTESSTKYRNRAERVGFVSSCE